MPESDTLLQAVACCFEESLRPAALAALEQYRGREATRVRLAILVLADSQLAEVERLVTCANDDYRDILYWAENPEESGSGTKQEMVARYGRLGIAVPPDLR